MSLWRLTAICGLAAVTVACAGPRRGPPLGGVGAPAPVTRLFVSPAGEPFRPGGDDDDPARVWFTKADSDGDGALTPKEFDADHMRFFRALDVDGDGRITNPENARYESDVFPEITRVGGIGRSGPGGGACVRVDQAAAQEAQAGAAVAGAADQAVEVPPAGWAGGLAASIAADEPHPGAALVRIWEFWSWPVVPSPSASPTAI